jgi:protein-disulfide isomerase
MPKIAIAALSLVAVACAGFEAEDPSPVVAGNGDVAITLAELDEWVKESLFRERTDDGEPSQLYEVRARALDRLIEERVVAHRAEQQGTDVETLLASAGSSVGDEEIAAFFEQNQADMRGQALEAVAPFIRTHLEQQNRRDAIAAWVQAADVRIQLEPPRFEIAANGPQRGASAPVVTIVEFSDFQCPFCRRAGPVLEQVLDRYPEDVQLVYRHLPLDSIHPRARPAAIASICAEEQGRFWDFHDAIFAGPNALEDGDLRALGEQVGLDLAAYDSCMDSEAHSRRVDADIAAARGAGITGTPAFLVNGVLLRGAQPFAAFDRIITHELAAAKASP